jgi:hypothetical protein
MHGAFPYFLQELEVEILKGIDKLTIFSLESDASSRFCEGTATREAIEPDDCPSKGSPSYPSKLKTLACDL